VINRDRCRGTPVDKSAELYMETTATAVFARTAECAALLAIGYQLRAARLFSATDAEVRPNSSHTGANRQLQRHTRVHDMIIMFWMSMLMCSCSAGRTEVGWVSHLTCSCAAGLQHVSPSLISMLARQQNLTKIGFVYHCLTPSASCSYGSSRGGFIIKEPAPAGPATVATCYLSSACPASTSSAHHLS
jgi:hypothetical protein